MSSLSLRCIRAGFAFLAFGIGLGASFALDRSLGPALRPLHAELNLWGWVTLLIYGMAYHMLPRFAGRALRWPEMATLQSWLAIGGVVLTTIGWMVQAGDLPLASAALLAGGGMQVSAVLLFTLLIGDVLLRRR